MTTDLSAHLARLESVGLVRVAQLEPELEYLFRHALIQDAIYQAMLKQSRREMHREVGDALESLFPDRAVELAPQLGAHFAEAGDDPRALKYLTLAGDSALDRYATAEAIQQYARAIDIARRTNASPEELLHLYTRHGRALELSARYDQALANYEALEGLGNERHLPALELSALMSRATIFSTFTSRYDPPQGIELSNRALEVAETLGDETAQAKIHWNLLLVYRSSGDAPRAEEHSQKSLEIARRLNLTEQIAFTLHDTIMLLQGSGQLDAALATAEESRATWRALGNRAMLADNLTTSSEILALTGRLDDAYALTLEAAEISRSIGNAWGESYALITGGFNRLYAGRLGDALGLIEASLPLAEAGGFGGYGLVVGSAILGLVYSYLGDLDRGRTLAEKSIDASRRFMPPFVALGEYVMALGIARAGDFAEADEWLSRSGIPKEMPDVTFLIVLVSIEGSVRLLEGKPQQALSQIEAVMSALPPHALQMIMLGEILIVRAEALAAVGRLAEARDEFKRVLRIADQSNSLYRRWEAHAGLAQIEDAAGDSKAAHKARQQARKALEDLIATLDDPKLAATFRATPAVAKLLAES